MQMLKSGKYNLNLEERMIAKMRQTIGHRGDNMANLVKQLTLTKF